MENLVMVYTSKSLKRIFDEGGTGNWKAQRNRVKKCNYVVLTQSNTYKELTEDEADLHSAFLIGRISGVKDAPESDERIVIEFSEYAEISVPDAWTGDRYPVAYLNIDEFEKKHSEDFNLEALEWIPFESNPYSKGSRSIEPNDIPALTIAQAKEGIARSLGIKPELVSITIAA